MYLWFKVGGSVIHRRKNGGVIANFHWFSDLDFRFFTVFPIHPQAALFIALFAVMQREMRIGWDNISDFQKKKKFYIDPWFSGYYCNMKQYLIPVSLSASFLFLAKRLYKRVCPLEGLPVWNAKI